MPTGKGNGFRATHSAYTACVLEGASFEEFVWGCARAMGALVTMRDERQNAKITLPLTPDLRYYDESLAEARAERDRVLALTDAEAQQDAGVEYATTMVHHDKYLAEVAEKRRLIEGMLERVRSWVPPSADHQGLKDFMLQQLQMTLDSDGKVYLTSPSEIESGAEYRIRKLGQAESSITYYEKQITEEIERTASRNAWLMELFASVPLPGAGI